MQQWAVNILFYCSLTQHVSGALPPIIRSTGNCIYSHRCRVYTDKIEVVEVKTVKTDSSTLACGTRRFKVISYSFYSFTFYDIILSV
jgi:hypothetical protein